MNPQFISRALHDLSMIFCGMSVAFIISDNLAAAIIAFFGSVGAIMIDIVFVGDSS